MEQSVFEKIYEIVKQIPYGQVATYGQVAALVVNREGRVSEAFAFGGGNRQIELLKAEGVEFVDGYVDMKRFQWERPVF